MAVWSKDEEVDPVGACVGQRGMRVERVVAELGNERIDIIPWSDDPAEYIANSLSPAKVSMVRLNERDKIARIIVADNQLSLAIGREGQNARLAAKLTGWKIDIKSQSQVMSAAAEEAMRMDEEAEEADEADEDGTEEEAGVDTLEE
jgi:N utilization substance protein A